MTFETAETMILDGNYIFRPTHMDDMENALALFHARSQIIVGAAAGTIDDLRADWSMPGFELEKSTRVVLTPDGKLIGYVEVHDTDDLPVHPRVWARVHPDFMNQGIGTALMTWGEERARQAIERCPADARVVIRAGALSTNEPTCQFLTNFGMMPIRRTYNMKIVFDGMPPAPQFPEGITVRAIKYPEEMRMLLTTVGAAFKDNWGYVVETLDKMNERWQHFITNDPLFDPSMWYMAMDGEQCIGTTLVVIHTDEEPELPWIEDVGVLRDYRGKGIALALLHHTFGELYRRGKKGARLGVDSQSLTGATRLYERAGMHVYRSWDTFEKELRPGKELMTQ